MRNALKPVYCPLCGRELDTVERDNSGNGSYHEWYWVGCAECGAHGEIAVNRE